MLPELRPYFLTSGRDFTVIQMTFERFWRLLSGDKTFVYWGDLRETSSIHGPTAKMTEVWQRNLCSMLDLLPPTFAGFAEDGQNTHVVDAIDYALNSVHAKAANEVRSFVSDPTIGEAAKRHPLVHREMQREEHDLTFLASLPDAPWPPNVFSMLRARAQAQGSLLGTRLNAQWPLKRVKVVIARTR